MIEYRIAIPSYQRFNTLKDKTLTALAAVGADPDLIDVFVANEREAAIYKQCLTAGTYSRIIVGKKGMGAIRRFIQQFYEDGQRIVNVDDDIEGFFQRVDEKTLAPLDDFDFFVADGFKAAKVAGCRLWGIYPVANAYFMKPRVATGLRYIIGAFWGVTNDRSEEVGVTMDDKEDYERTIKFYLADGNVARLDYVTMKTRYYKEPGGMQVERTEERVTESAHELVHRYPYLCQINKGKKSSHTEVKLRDTRPEPTPSAV